MTAEEMDAEIPAGVTSYEDWLRELESATDVLGDLPQHDKS